MSVVGGKSTKRLIFTASALIYTLLKWKSGDRGIISDRLSSNFCKGYSSRVFMFPANYLDTYESMHIEIRSAVESLLKDVHSRYLNSICHDTMVPIPNEVRALGIPDYLISIMFRLIEMKRPTFIGDDGDKYFVILTVSKESSHIISRCRYPVYSLDSGQFWPLRTATGMPASSGVASPE